MWRDKIRSGYHQFSATVEAVEHYVVQWFDGDRSVAPDLDQFSIPVVLKSKKRTITCVNAAYREFFSHCDELPVGKHSDEIVEDSTLELSRQTDAFLLENCVKIHLEYFTVGRSGDRFLVRCNKTNLEAFGYEPYSILFIGVPIKQVPQGDGLKYDIAKQFAIYQQLSSTQKRICALCALGETTRATARALGVSTKTIEKHRQRALVQLGLDRPVEIVQLLVRFEERGLIKDLSKSE
ncbi:helix-turn-helix transcriptional regulator [Roseiconus lacunae]|uniref:LuxR C-terminal-related transcriptional regulator n=1 Tax=Roseiconus lacunae TaxID=2605694 RepID=A0ABT7PN66_9BACT|nr:LuxR C-terminal-related transcriptional regulator [Roseiconus lacunae]MCD0463326.1 LuxR C-terminal-related transcriptional regulator [Roseiconus lacunae]MDM4017954.1 LuxR C-terminal-related transcriptional regulator [Roseiconus lacunae]WRQ52472.1 LuxR C-terminal-related transcriptional regulator [Stieleria sp. HD01]